MSTFLWHVLLTILSYPVIFGAHELGHLVVGRLAGIPVRQIIIGANPATVNNVLPSLFLFGIPVYFGATHAICCVVVDDRLYQGASQARRTATILAGPMFGALASLWWALSSTSTYEQGLGWVWLVCQLVNLLAFVQPNGVRSDGEQLREMWAR